MTNNTRTITTVVKNIGDWFYIHFMIYNNNNQREYPGIIFMFNKPLPTTMIRKLEIAKECIDRIPIEHAYYNFTTEELWEIQKSCFRAFKSR